MLFRAPKKFTQVNVSTNFYTSAAAKVHSLLFGTHTTDELRPDGQIKLVTFDPEQILCI